MATIEDGFKQVLSDFKKRLKPEEEARFAFTTLADLEVAANDLQEKQRGSKTAQNLRRIEPFLQAMAQYKGIIEVFLNTSSILCFVWGPMKFMLLVSRCCAPCQIPDEDLTVFRLQAIGTRHLISYLMRTSKLQRTFRCSPSIVQCLKRTIT
jgi:hypothetical protein